MAYGGSVPTRSSARRVQRSAAAEHPLRMLGLGLSVGTMGLVLAVMLSDSWMQQALGGKWPFFAWALGHGALLCTGWYVLRPRSSEPGFFTVGASALIAQAGFYALLWIGILLQWNPTFAEAMPFAPSGVVFRYVTLAALAGLLFGPALMLPLVYGARRVSWMFAAQCLGPCGLVWAMGA